MYGKVRRRRLEPVGAMRLHHHESEARVDIKSLCSLHQKFVCKT
jgi:hypothetical protein